MLTTLDRIGSPLLRYRTGDLVKAAGAGTCACGRNELAFDGGILGRSDDMVVVRGVNVYPALIEEIIRQRPDVVEYRVKLDCRCAMPELAIELELLADSAVSNPERICQQIEESLQALLNLRVPVSALPHGSLPRFEMKAQRWVRLTAQ